jgi:ATP synthase protein I
MREENKHKEEQSRFHEDFRSKVEARQRRKLRAIRHSNRSVWFGFGMFGLVGWSVAVPTLLFTALGVWLDTVFTGRYSWTLMLLVVGVCLGCLNAWFWVSKERKEIEKEMRNEEDWGRGKDGS